jgi:Domain of unknown function (DUF4926)
MMKTLPLYSDVILLRNLPQHSLSAGDIGTVVAMHDVAGLEAGCSVEFFDVLGNTIAIVTLPMSYFCDPSTAF